MGYDKETFDRMNNEINEYRVTAQRLERMKERRQTEKNEQRTIMLNKSGEMTLELNDIKKALDDNKVACFRRQQKIEEQVKELRKEREKRGKLWKEYNTLRFT